MIASRWFGPTVLSRSLISSSRQPIDSSRRSAAAAALGQPLPQRKREGSLGPEQLRASSGQVPPIGQRGDRHRRVVEALPDPKQQRVALASHSARGSQRLMLVAQSLSALLKIGSGPKPTPRPP